MNDRVSVTLEDGVADVRLMRPDKMNALDDAMFEGIAGAIDQLKSDKTVRVVVLSGEGRAFCAGLDMGNFGRMATGERRGGGESGLGGRSHGLANRAQYVAWGWRELPVPVIAAVHGVAFGGGFQVCLGADMRFVAPDTRMAVMEIKWGLVPDMAGLALMRHLAREDLVRELTYTGRIFSGEEALAYGFATRVCADPRAEALSLAREIAGKSPSAIRAAKRLINQAAEGEAGEVLIAESVEQGSLIGGTHQVEAVRANLEKRAPAFVD